MPVDQLARRAAPRARTGSRPRARLRRVASVGRPRSSNSRPPAPTTSSKNVPNSPDSRPGNAKLAPLASTSCQVSGGAAQRSSRTHSTRTSTLRGTHSSAPPKRQSPTARGASSASSDGSTRPSSGRSQRACDGAYLACVEIRSRRSPRPRISATRRFSVGWSACTTTSTSPGSSSAYIGSYIGPPTSATRSGVMTRTPRPASAPRRRAGRSRRRSSHSASGIGVAKQARVLRHLGGAARPGEDARDRGMREREAQRRGLEVDAVARAHRGEPLRARDHRRRRGRVIVGRARRRVGEEPAVEHPARDDAHAALGAERQQIDERGLIEQRVAAREQHAVELGLAHEAREQRRAVHPGTDRAHHALRAQPPQCGKGAAQRGLGMVVGIVHVQDVDAIRAEPRQALVERAQGRVVREVVGPPRRAASRRSRRPASPVRGRAGARPWSRARGRRAGGRAARRRAAARRARARRAVRCRRSARPRATRRRPSRRRPRRPPARTGCRSAPRRSRAA